MRGEGGGGRRQGGYLQLPFKARCQWALHTSLLGSKGARVGDVPVGPRHPHSFVKGE